MSHERAQANLEVVFDWMNAMRHRDLDAIAELFDEDVVWVDVAGRVACDGRDQALSWLRSTPTELNDVDAIELLANEDHVLLGVRNHTREELAGVQLEDGQTFTVFTLHERRIVRLQGHIHREEALDDAGLNGFRWR